MVWLQFIQGLRYTSAVLGHPSGFVVEKLGVYDSEINFMGARVFI